MRRTALLVMASCLTLTLGMWAWAGQRGITQGELNNFGAFLNRHPNIAHKLSRNPHLINNQDFIDNNPHLKNFLNDHQGVNGQIKAHPEEFMRRVGRYPARHHGTYRYGNQHRGAYSSAPGYKYFEQNPDVARQIRNNPELLHNRKWMAEHPQVGEYMRQHPGWHGGSERAHEHNPGLHRGWEKRQQPPPPPPAPPPVSQQQPQQQHHHHHGHGQGAGRDQN